MNKVADSLDRGDHELGIVISLGFISLVIRTGAMFFLHSYQFQSNWEMGFEMGALAHSMVSGNGFSLNGEPSAWMAPLFPTILAITFWLFGSYSTTSAIAILFLQAVVSSLTVVAVYLLGKKLFGAKVGVVAGIFWVLHLGAINYSVRRIWDSSFTALGLTLIVLALLQLRERPYSIWRAVLCGLIVGTTALFNPVVLVFIPLALIWLVYSSRAAGPRSLAGGGIVVLTMVMTLVPWTARNQRVFSSFVPVKSTFGINLWQGNNPYVEKIGEGILTLETLAEHLPDTDIEWLSSLNEAELASVLGREAIEYILKNPLTFANYTLVRAATFWTIGFKDSGIPGGGFAILASWALLMSVIALAATGIILARRHWETTSLLVLVFIAFPIPYYLTITDTYRYRFPLEPLLLVFASFVVVRLAPWLQIQILGPRSERPIGQGARS